MLYAIQPVAALPALRAGHIAGTWLRLRLTVAVRRSPRAQSTDRIGFRYRPTAPIRSNCLAFPHPGRNPARL